MFFVTELLRVVLGLHRTGIIHGDLKIDNCLLRLDDVSRASSWSGVYSRDGSAGWSCKGLTLIDFGRAIDLCAFGKASEQTFIADWQTDERDCFQMRNHQPFTFETDWFGIAAIAHCLLFGRYMHTKHDAQSQKHTITATLKRYWQSHLWNTLFDICLNPSAQHEPLNTDHVLESLESCLDAMHHWLEANSNKGGRNLKGLLRKLEIWAMKQGR